MELPNAIDYNNVYEAWKFMTLAKAPDQDGMIEVLVLEFAERIQKMDMIMHKYGRKQGPQWWEELRAMEQRVKKTDKALDYFSMLSEMCYAYRETIWHIPYFEYLKQQDGWKPAADKTMLWYTFINYRLIKEIINCCSVIEEALEKDDEEDFEE